MRDPGLSSVKTHDGLVISMVLHRLSSEEGFPSFSTSELPSQGQNLPLSVGHTTHHPQEGQDRLLAPFPPLFSSCRNRGVWKLLLQETQAERPALVTFTPPELSGAVCAVHAGTPGEACGSLHSDVIKCLKQRTQEFRENPT